MTRSLALVATLALLALGAVGCGNCEALVEELANLDCQLDQCLGFGTQFCETPEDIAEAKAGCGIVGGALDGVLEAQIAETQADLAECQANPPVN